MGLMSLFFSGHPGGLHLHDGLSHFIEDKAYWWSVTKYFKDNSRASPFFFDDNMILSGNKLNKTKVSKSCGLSVRCIKNMDTVEGSDFLNKSKDVQDELSDNFRRMEDLNIDKNSFYVKE